MQTELINKFLFQVEKFRKWIGEDLKYYIINGVKPNGETYGNLKALIEITKEIVKNLSSDKAYIVNYILYVMAIDNETEDIKEYIIDCCSEEQLDILIDKGYNYCLSSVRWQIAVIINKRYLPKYFRYIEALKHDKDSYVCKRAGIVLND